MPPMTRRLSLTLLCAATLAFGALAPLGGCRSGGDAAKAPSDADAANAPAAQAPAPGAPSSDGAGAADVANDRAPDSPDSPSAPDSPGASDDDADAPAADPALDAFAEQVTQALEAGDIDALAPVLSDPFALGYDAAEWQVLDPEATAEQLRNTHMPAGTKLSVTNSDRAVRSALAGRVDLDALFGPQVTNARMLLVKGWDGEPGREGVVFLTPSSSPGPEYVWTALLIVR